MLTNQLVENAMKSSRFIFYIFAFLMTWVALTVGGWGLAQQFSSASIMPWVISVLSNSPHVLSQAMGGVIAVGGGFLMAIATAAALFTVVGLVLRLKRMLTKSNQSRN